MEKHVSAQHIDFEYYDLQEEYGYNEFKKRGFTDLEFEEFKQRDNILKLKLPIILEE